MGCIFSHTDRHAINSRKFHVYNVDDQGVELNPGWIEVGDTDLILHQRGKESIKWPLRCLRRYGFDAELFSFESGRRCPTGPGIYAFKCRRAEELFNLVQECIQRVGQEDHNINNMSHANRVSRNLLGGTTRTNSRPSSIAENLELNGFLVPSPGPTNNTVADPSDLHLYENGSVIPEGTGHDYINTGQPDTDNRSRSLPNGTLNMDHTLNNLIDFLHDPPLPQQKSVVSYALLDLPKSSEDLTEDNAEGWCAYRNGHPDSDGLPSAGMCDMNYADLDVFMDVAPDTSEQHNYINVGKDVEVKDEKKPEYGHMVGLKDGAQAIGPNPVIQEPNYANLTLQPASTPPRSRTAAIGMLNYIQVDVDPSSGTTASGPSNTTPTSPVSYNLYPDSPNKRTESYAMIDFHRTAALSNSSRTHTDGDDGVRKTRHNSTISDVLT